MASKDKAMEQQGIERSDMRAAAKGWDQQAEELKGAKENFLGKQKYLIDPKKHVYQELLYPGKSKNKTYY